MQNMNMNQQDLFRTVQVQQAELTQLRTQLNQALSFEVKYKKALKQISEIIKANRQLKDQLRKLSNYKNAQGQNMNRINQQELGKAYQKILKEKNQILGEKQALELDNQKLKYTVNSLEEAVNKLKNQKMALAREKQGIARINDNSSEKHRDTSSKQAQLRKTLENYQQRHQSLSKTNRRLEQQITEIQNKLYNTEADYKTKLNDKDLQLKICKTNAREQYQAQINALKKQITALKSSNGELMSKVSFYSEREGALFGVNAKNSGGQYEEQLVQTLRELKMEMAPLSSQIAQLQQKSQLQRQTNQRQKAALQIKVMQYQSQIQRMKQAQKILEQKLLKQSDKSRRWQETEKTIKKLQQQNRMLGGRIIVLQAKQVALRNRSGDQLQQRVYQFQTRVQMLLSDKQTLINTKNVGIHQLIALKAYIMQLDAKLKQVVNQNQYAVKKYKSYKQKCTQLIRELKQHDIAINALKGKLQGYDRLVVKLQGQLERAITINDNQMKAINVKISQSTYNSIQIYKKRYQSLLEKLNLQQKYAEQQIQTLKLNYDTKLLDLNLKLQQLSSIKETILLYKTKNQQLSNKLTQKQNQLLQSKMNKLQITDTIPVQKNPHKQVINKLNQTINAKESTIVGLEAQIRRIQMEWKSKYNQLEANNGNILGKKSREQEQLRKIIGELQGEIKGYRGRINQLQLKASQTVTKQQIVHHDYKNTYKITGKISDLQIQLEQMRNRYQIQSTKVGKLTKLNSQLKQINNDLESELSRLRFELKRIEKQMALQLSGKDNELKRIQSRLNQSGNIANIDQSQNLQKQDSEVNPFKFATLKMELQLLQGNNQQLEKDKIKYYNRALELQRYNSELAMKIEELTFALERTKNNMNNDYSLRQTQREQEVQLLQYNLRSFKDKNRDLEQRINQYEQQLTKSRNQNTREKQRVLGELDGKNQELMKVTRELNKLRSELTNQDDVHGGIREQYQYKLNRLNGELSGLRLEVQERTQLIRKYQIQLRNYRNKDMQTSSKNTQQERYFQSLTFELNKLKNHEVQLESELLQKQTLISKLTGQLNYIRAELVNIEDTMNGKDTQITKLTSELNNLRSQFGDVEETIRGKDNQIMKLNSQLNYIKGEFEHYQENAKGKDGQVNRLMAELSSLRSQYSEFEETIRTKDNQISKFNSQLNFLRNQLKNIQEDISGKDSQIARLNSQLNMIKNSQIQWQMQVSNKTGDFNRVNIELSNARNRVHALQDQLQDLRAELSRTKGRFTSYETDHNSLTQQLQDKDAMILRLQNQNRNRSQQLEQLHSELLSKTTRLTQLQNETTRYRSLSSDTQNQLVQKQSQISRLQYELNNFRIRYENLENQHEIVDNNWNNLNRELNGIRAQIGNYQQEMEMKNGVIERYKSDIRELQVQMQRINQQIFQKNNLINNLNQKLFSLKLEGQSRSSEQIFKLQGQISILKSRVFNLERELQMKQQQLGRARLEISTVRSQITINKYSDEQYDLLQAQFYQVQKSLTETRGAISEKDLEITQLQAKIQYMKKMQVQNRKRFVDQRNDLEKQLENVLNRQRQLRNQINNLQNQAYLNQNRQNQQKQWGMHLYQAQCDRLTKIVTDLQEQVSALKLKLTYMTNQQDRIVENLTIMTLTFAEVEALRQRMKTKQNQISQVRKSLINFATSSQEIGSRNSRGLQERANNQFSRYATESQQRPSIDNIQSRNININVRINNTDGGRYDSSVVQPSAFASFSVGGRDQYSQNRGLGGAGGVGGGVNTISYQKKQFSGYYQANNATKPANTSAITANFPESSYQYQQQRNISSIAANQSNISSSSLQRQQPQQPQNNSALPNNNGYNNNNSSNVQTSRNSHSYSFGNQASLIERRQVQENVNNNADNANVNNYGNVSNNYNKQVSGDSYKQSHIQALRDVQRYNKEDSQSNRSKGSQGSQGGKIVQGGQIQVQGQGQVRTPTQSQGQSQNQSQNQSQSQSQKQSQIYSQNQSESQKNLNIDNVMFQSGNQGSQASLNREGSKGSLNRSDGQFISGGQSLQDQINLQKQMFTVPDVAQLTYQYSSDSAQFGQQGQQIKQSEQQQLGQQFSQQLPQYSTQFGVIQAQQTGIQQTGTQQYGSGLTQQTQQGYNIQPSQQSYSLQNQQVSSQFSANYSMQSQGQVPQQGQASWRFGSANSSSSSLHQPKSQTPQIVGGATRTQPNVKVNLGGGGAIGSTNTIGSNKVIPPGGASYGVPTTNIPGINQGIGQPPQQLPQMQARQFGIPQPLQYPGFAR